MLSIYEKRFPGLPWREPIKVCGVSSTGQPITRFACRVCIAMHGLKGYDVELLSDDYDAVAQHIKTHL